MWNMNDVMRIHYKKDYVFRIEFDNGVAGDIDFAEYLNKGPVFLPLRGQGIVSAGNHRRRHHRLAQWC